jgi:D-alanyl-D-alanine carboxypeptidase (penicillin-binding protein 5/6)
VRRRAAIVVLGVAVALSASTPLTAGAAAPARGGAPHLEARAWILVDERTGEPLAGNASARPLPIASATKLMTAHLALERLPLRRRIPAAPYSALSGESLLGVPAGTRISVRDLLYALILESANDAAVSVARAVSGSERAFVVAMNRSAAALGLVDTQFANPIGLDEPGNHSSARDLAALGRDLMGVPVFRRIASTRSALLRSLRPPRRIETRNTLLYRAGWLNGIKTGHTLGAGYVLVASGRRGGVELISVVLGAPSEEQRDAESLELLDYGFSLYATRRPVRRGETLASPAIRFADGELPLRAARTIAAGVRRGQRLDLRISAPDEVEGPLRRGSRLGRVEVTVDGLPAGSAPLLASRSIPRAGAFDRVRGEATDRPYLLVAGVFVIVIAVLAGRRWLHRRAGSDRTRQGGGVPGEEEMAAMREQRRREREQRRGDGEQS